MEKFTEITSTVVPIPIKDIDTDMIIPAQYLTSTSREGYGQGLFRALRESDSQFPLNLERFNGAQILVSDSNFGCGSSREHAVWALLGGGFRVVIAKSFADIFNGNSGKNGLVLVVLPNSVVDRIMVEAARGGYEVKIELENQTVTLPDGTSESFDYDPYRKRCIINGYDDLDYILSKQAEIARFRKTQEKVRFYSTLQVNNPETR